MTTNTFPSPEAPAVSSRRNLQEGILLMVIGMLLLPGIDAIAKGLSGSLSAGLIAWSRFFFQTLFLLPFVLHARSFRVSGRLWAHAARGLLLASATLCFFASLGKLPLADAIAIFFVEPFILTLLSAVFLGEKIGWRRLLAVTVGFCGALIIIRPSYAVFGLTALLPMGAALSFALYVVLTRTLVRADGAVTLQFNAGLFGGLAMSGALWFGFEAGIGVLTPSWPTGTEWLALAGLGAIATTGHLFIVNAIRRLGASLVAPFQYLEIISATLLGLIFFGDFPAPTTWLGVAIIVASGVYVFLRERKRAAEEDARGAGN